MNDSIKDLYGDMEDDSFACYLGHYVFDFPRTLIDPNFDVYSQPNVIHLDVYFAGKTTEELIDYYQLIRKKVDSELAKTGGDLNRITSTPDTPKKVYSVIANNIDYSAQDILQDNFSIKSLCQKSNNLFELARKAYCHHFSDAIIKIKNVGFHGSLRELQDNLLDDLVKANSLGYIKESVKEDTTGIDQYGFWMIPITIYETIPYEDGVGAEVKDYTIYFAAKDKNQTEKYENIIKNKILKEFNVVIMGGKVIKQDKAGQRASVKVEWPTKCFSVVAGQVDFDSQDILQPDYSIRQGIENNYINNPRTTNPSKIDYRFTSGVYSDLLVKAINVGIYKTEDEFQEHYFEDMVNSANQEKEVEECFGGGMGGVTTASFAPAVTHTVYPKPGKKKSKKEDSDETIADVYSYYGCVVRLSLSFPGSDTKVRKYYIVLGKDLGQIDEFNQKINQNIKQISNDSCILSTTLTSMLYSTEIKDFDFEGQKILDSSLYVNDPKKFISNEKQLDQEEVQIRDIMGRSYDNLADFTNDLFTKLTEDTTSDLTVEDIYGFYSTVVTIAFDAGSSKYMDFLYKMETNFMVLIGKTPEQLKEFIEKARNNVSFIDRAKLLETEEVFHLYNAEIKDFNFEGQKLLDSSLFSSDPNKMKKNAKPLLDDQIRIKKIVVDSADNLVDFTDNLFSQMTEDTDDVYWPVRNDDTDEFENMIKNARKTKKEKIIARKERAIKKREETLFNWLRKMAAEEKYSTIAIHEKALKYNAVTDKMRAELEKIKRLPLDSPEFF